MTDRRPNFIHIGPGKTGSTWLHEVLITHPQIFMTEAKDLYFFDRYYERGFEWYLGQFDDARPEHKIVGEVCQQYMFSPEAPGRIHECLPEVRLMLTLREPAARAFSSYLYQSKHGAVSGSFREALETRPGLLNTSRYASHLKRYLQYFDRSAIYIGLFDDLKDPQGFIDPLLHWLGVAPMTLDAELLAARLPASSARSTALARTVRDAADWARRRNAARLVGRVKRSALVHKALYKPLGGGPGGVKPTMSAEDAQYVRDRLAEEMVELEGMLGMDLRTRWKWERG